MYKKMKWRRTCSLCFSIAITMTSITQKCVNEVLQQVCFIFIWAVAVVMLFMITNRWWYIHTHSTEYTYNAATVSNGLVVSCNTTTNSQMCVYNYDNVIHHCVQNLTADCMSYNSACLVIVNANNGYCNNYTEYPNKVMHHTQLNAIGVFFCVISSIITCVHFGLITAFIIKYLRTTSNETHEPRSFYTNAYIVSISDEPQIA